MKTVEDICGYKPIKEFKHSGSILYLTIQPKGLVIGMKLSYQIVHGCGRITENILHSKEEILKIVGNVGSGSWAKYLRIKYEVGEGLYYSDNNHWILLLTDPELILYLRKYKKLKGDNKNV